MAITLVSRAVNSASSGLTITCPPGSGYVAAPIAAGDTILVGISTINGGSILPSGVSDNLNGAYTLVAQLQNPGFFNMGLSLYTITSSVAIPNPAANLTVTASCPSSTRWSIFFKTYNPGVIIDNYTITQATLTAGNGAPATASTSAFASNANELFYSLITESDNFSFALNNLTGIVTIYNQTPTSFGTFRVNVDPPAQLVPAAGLYPLSFQTDGTAGQMGYVWFEGTFKLIGQSTAALPIATVKFYNAVVNTPLVVYAPGLLINDTGPSLTVTANTNPSHGTLSAFGTDGSFTYTPNTNYTGNDLFSYTITDLFGQTSSANVIISVNPFSGLGVVVTQSRSRK